MKKQWFYSLSKFINCFSGDVGVSILSIMLLTGPVLIRTTNYFISFIIPFHFFTYLYYLVLAFFILVSWKEIIKRIHLVDILLVFLIISFICASGLILDRMADAKTTVVNVLISCLPTFFGIKLVVLSKRFKLYLWIGALVTVFSFFVYMLFINKYSSTDREMTISYYCSFFTMASIMFLNEKSRALKIISVLVYFAGLITLFISNSRGPLLVAVIFGFYASYVYSKHKIATAIGFFALCLLCVLILFTDLFSSPFLALGNWLLKIGINARFVDFLTKPGSFINLSGRNILLYATFYDIMKEPLAGHGLFGSWDVFNVFKYSLEVRGYSHNFLMEIWSNYGLLFGSALLICLCYILFKCYKKTSVNKNYQMFYFMMCLLGFFVLFFTGSFFIHSFSWGLIAISLSVWRTIISDSTKKTFGFLRDDFINDLNQYPNGYLVKQPHRIVHIMLSNPLTDGIDYQEAILAKKHFETGHEVMLIVSSLTSNQNKEIIDVGPMNSNSINGYSICRLDIEKHKKIKRKLAFCNGLYSLLLDYSPDTIFIHNNLVLNNNDIYEYCLRKECNVFMDSHADMENMSFKHSFIKMFGINYFLQSLFLCHSGSFISKYWGVTPGRCAYLHDIFGIDENKIGQLNMGVDDKQLTNIESRENILDKYKICSVKDSFLIVFGGVIDANKNLEKLIDSFKIIRTTHKDTALLIFGSIKSGYEIDLNVEGLFYLGFLSNEEITQLFCVADLGVFPGSHSVLWEQAVGCGLPCVFKRIPGKEHVLNNNNCVLIDDNENLSQVILKFIENKDYCFKIKNNANSESKKNFYYSVIAKKAIDGPSLASNTTGITAFMEIDI